MKKVVIVAIAIGVLLLVVAAWRWIEVLPYPMGGGQHLASPDGKLEARAADLTDKTFWGGERDYYEFSVSPTGAIGSSAATKTVRMDIIPGTTRFSMRGGPNIILWSSDSKSVTFAFHDIELTLHVGPAPAGGVLKAAP